MSVPQWKPKLDIRDRALTLPESKALPSVIFFAECILSDTRQTISLPSAKLKTLGKDSDTRQTLCLSSALLKNTRQTFWHSAILLKNTRQTPALGKYGENTRQITALGKHRATCPSIALLPSVRWATLGKQFIYLFSFDLETFLYSTNNIAKSMLKFSIFWICLLFLIH